MYLGELVVKLTTVNLLATLESDRDRHRYRLEHKLVRATGIGEWVQALDDLLTGPASQHRVQATAPAVREITQTHGSQESAWQVESVQLLQRVQAIPRAFSQFLGRQDKSPAMVCRLRLAAKQDSRPRCASSRTVRGACPGFGAIPPFDWTEFGHTRTPVGLCSPESLRKVPRLIDLWPIR